MATRGEITQLLSAARRGEKGAMDRLVALVYDELHAMAHRQLDRWRPGQTLNTTALIHETYLKLVDQSQVGWQDRTHFLSVAAVAMRHIVVDYARRRAAKKRAGGAHQIRLDESQLGVEVRVDEIIALDEALTFLAAAVAVLVLFAGAMGLLAFLSQCHASRVVRAVGRANREAARANREVMRVKNSARVAVAESWITKDPTRAALVLLEVEKPDEIAMAVPAIRKVLQHRLATLELSGHQREVESATWSPNGKRIATGSLDNTVRVWNVDGRGRSIVLDEGGRSPLRTRSVHACASPTSRLEAGAPSAIY